MKKPALRIVTVCILFSLALLFSACATREELARRQRLQELNQEMESSQKSTTDLLIRLQEFEERLNQLQGRIEDKGHDNQQKMQQRFSDLEENFKLLKEQLNESKSAYDKSAANIETMKNKLEGQEKYIDEVLKTLSKITGQNPKSKKEVSPYDEAMSIYSKGKYSDAKAKLESLLRDKSIKGNRKARVIHNLGMIEYMAKDYDTASAYFGKLFSEYPKAPYVPNGLLYLAKAFQKMGKMEEAQQILSELISKYPKSRQVGDAKKMLK